VVARERFTRAQLGDGLAAELAAVAIAREQERIRDLPAEPARHVDELRQADDGGRGNARCSDRTGRAESASTILSLAVDDEAQRALQRHHRQRFERRIQGQAPYDHTILRSQS
jgi:hypothetical protein